MHLIIWRKCLLLVLLAVGFTPIIRAQSVSPVGGKKLYEELLAADENSLPTPHPKLRIAKARQENGAWLARLLEWLGRHGDHGDAETRSDLARWVPEYRNE